MLVRGQEYCILRRILRGKRISKRRREGGSSSRKGGVVLKCGFGNVDDVFCDGRRLLELLRLRRRGVPAELLLILLF